MVPNSIPSASYQATIRVSRLHLSAVAQVRPQTAALVFADTIDEMAEKLNVPVEPLRSALLDIPVSGKDQFGRSFGDTPLSAPYVGVRVTGALFHTQGGLNVNQVGQVIHLDGTVFPNLFAGGGAACGVSGASDSGYLSGNGLLSAVVLGYRAGAAEL